jgi:hypothetical protein
MIDGVQCAHEYAIDGKFRVDKYSQRWYPSWSPLLESLSNEGVLRRSNIEQHEPVVQVENSTESHVPIPGDVQQDPMQVNFAYEEVNDNDNTGLVLSDGDSTQMDNPVPSFIEVRQLGIDLAEAVSQDSERRLYLHALQKGMLSIIRTKSVSLFKERVQSALLQNDEPNNLFQEVNNDNSNQVIQSPLRARPSQGGRTECLRKRSSVEGPRVYRRPSKKQVDMSSGVNMSQGLSQAGTEERDPISRPPGTKSCGFCKQSGHTITSCMRRLEFGVLLEEHDRRILAANIYKLQSYRTEKFPEERSNEVVFQAIPGKTMCVVLWKRFVKKNASTSVNGSQEIICECTILKDGAATMEFPSSSRQLFQYDKCLFTVSAIAGYVHPSNKRKVISNLIPCN